MDNEALEDASAQEQALPRDYVKLEFDRIRELLASYASSSLGQALARELSPSQDLEQARRLQEVTSEARQLCQRFDRIPLGGLHDIRGICRRALKRAVLRPGELLEIWDTLRAGNKLQHFIRRHGRDAEEGYKRLSDLAGRIETFPDLVAHIERCIAETGDLKDDASPKLRSLRQRIDSLKNRIKDTLQGYLRSKTQQYLQDPLITMRQNRYVLPVKQEYRDQVPGVVHDQSASGATLFIEPIQVVRLNNELREAELAEEAEIERILTQLSAHVSAVGEQLLWTVEVLAELDFAFAKGRFSIALDAVEPELNDEGWVCLKGARHPLLGSGVVPIDIWIGRGFRTLVITGPNTGGKTVTLKTVGLFALMAGGGLHLPCDPGCEQAVFRGIYCDIGDEQSIEQNLSTFSSHMTNIVRIIGRAGPRSLVLLDEIGAGTDPTEGSALAMALLEHFYDMGSRTVATTHYSQLKLFAYHADGIENASVEFDAATLEPTYKLVIGVPGRSNAIDIAARLGLNRNIAARARDWVSSEQLEVDTIIRRMEEDQQRIEHERIEAEHARSAASRLHAQASEVLGDARAEREAILEEAREEARQLVYDARHESERLIGVLRELIKKQEEWERRGWQAGDSEELSESRREVYTGIEEVRKALGEARASIENREPARHGPRQAPEVREGDYVNVRSLRKEGTVLELHDGEAVVQLGIMKVTVATDDLEPAEKEHEQEQNRERVQRLAAGKAETFSPELHVRGMTVDEALHRIDKYLDDAFLAGQKQVRLVHGKGTGTLRRAVHDYLSTHPQVTGFRLADRSEGGYGVTVVTLKPS